MNLTINGRDREFSELDSDPKLLRLLELLQLKPDRVAIERNGDIVPRASWAGVVLANGDKLEVVQFVGGGLELRSLLSNPQKC
ncbi:MAG: sulfur carrier protein ThiS [Acidobacteriaceae bacterium]